MLERLRSAGWAWTLLCCLLPMCAWFACDSTETGNPPVLDQDGIYWLRRDADAEIIGEPGAVKPGGSVVEVLIGSNVVGRVESKPDGSFTLTAQGAGEQSFSVRAVNGRVQSDTLSSTTIQQRDPPASSEEPSTELDAASDAGVAMPPASSSPDAAATTPDAAAAALDATTSTATTDAQPSGASMDAQSTQDAAVALVDSAACMDLHQQAETRLTQVLTQASVGCGTADDCVLVSINSSCYEGCNTPVVRAKAADVSAAVAQIEQQVCTPHNAMSCAIGGQRCELPAVTLLCVQSECVLDGMPQVIDAGRN